MASIFPLIVSANIAWSMSGLDGLKCGKDGPQTFAMGDSTAQFTCKNGLREGPFKVIAKSGVVTQKGQFVRGQLHGKVVQSDDRGPNVEIEYVNGRLSGTASVYQVMIDKFVSDKIKLKDGIREGLTVKYYGPNQLVSERMFKAGVFEGLSKSYDNPRRDKPSVLVGKSLWKNGRLDGLSQSFDPATGKLKDSKTYKEGKPLDPAGKIKTIGVAVDPRVSVAAWKEPNSEGQDRFSKLAAIIKCKTEGRSSELLNPDMTVVFFGCKNGNLDGPIAMVGAWYSRDMFGRVELLANFTKGKLSGPAYRYDYVGLQEEISFKDGLRHGPSRYYFNGNQIYELEFTSGVQGTQITFFDEQQASSFKVWQERTVSYQLRQEAMKTAVCDQADKPWDESLCLERLQKGTASQARVISEIGCNQKNARACMYLGFYTNDPEVKKRRWEEGCRYSAAQCHEFINLFMYSMRYDYMMEIATLACNNGLQKACDDRKRIEPELLKQNELKRMALEGVPKFEPKIRAIREANAQKAIDYKLGSDVSFEQMEKIILNEKPVNRRVTVPITRCGSLSPVENDEFGYAIDCSGGHRRVWYRIVVDRALAETLPKKFGVELEKPVFLTGTVIKLQSTGVLDVMVIVPDSSEL
jgi:antitoxin component YwqK of YwqJK toxin-antitoxin module